MVAGIVVTGAAGQLGRLVIAGLLKIAPAAHVIGIVRNAAAARTWRIAVSSSGRPTTTMPPPSRGGSRAPPGCL